MAAEPLDDLGVLVGGVVVDDSMHQLAGWHPGLDGVEEADELLVAVTLHAATDDVAVYHVERGEQGGGAVGRNASSYWSISDRLGIGLSAVVQMEPCHWFIIGPTDGTELPRLNMHAAKALLYCA